MSKILSAVISVSIVAFLIFSPGSFAGTLEPINMDSGASNIVSVKPITLTYCRAGTSNIEGGANSNSEFEVYKELEKRTNIKISFIYLPEEYQLQKLNVMAAAGEIPDLIELPWMKYPGMLENYAEMGIILRLDEYIKNFAPNLNEILKSNIDVKRQITSDNGHIYQVPALNLAHNRANTGLIVRGDLLKKYGLAIPNTLDEWEKMLTVFRDNEDCRFPLTFDMAVFDDTTLFVGAFGTTLGFGVRDGKVFYGPIEQSYKEFLSVFGRWYQNALIDPEFLILRKQMLKDRIGKGEAGAFIGTADDLKDAIDSLRKADSSYELIPVRNPVLRETDDLSITSCVSRVSEYGIAISGINKYPEESMKWIDYAYSEEGYRLFNFGIEGLTYTMKNGRIEYTDLILNNSDNLSVQQAMAGYLGVFPAIPGYRTDESIEKSFIYQQQKDAVKLWSESTGSESFAVMPPVSYTREESNELSVLMENISTYKKEMFAKFVLGAESPERFDEFVRTVKKLGIERAIEINQAALDRYYNRLPKMMVNEKVVDTDTDPFIIMDGNVLVPFRFVIEGLGGGVAWDGENKIVTAVWNNNAVILKINSVEVLDNVEVLVNNKPVNLNTGIMFHDRRTYVPAEFLKNSLGIDVRWDENTRTVSVTGIQ